MIQSEWFEKKTFQNKRTIYISKTIAEPLDLKRNDKFAIEIKDIEAVVFPARISTAITNSGVSYRVDVPKEFRDCLNKDKILMKVTKLDCVDTKNNQNGNLNSSKIVNDFKHFSVTTWIDSDYIVIWHETEKKRPYRPLIVRKNIRLTNELAKYVGLYFAEGNKQGFYRIYASNKNLARLVIKSYCEIIKNSKLKFSINFNKSERDNRSDDEIKNVLINYWKDVINPNVIRIATRRFGTLKDSEKHAKFGTLMIEDSRILPRILHAWLIKSITNENNYKNIIEKFFEGGILGDGSIAIRTDRKRKAYRYIEIGSNKQEVSIWEKICRLLNFRYEKQIRKGNDVIIRINNYCDVVQLLKKGFLKDFPQQRDKLIYGLKNRIETYILYSLVYCSDYSVYFKGEFARRASSYLVVNKGELISNNFINFDGKSISLTFQGNEFINNLRELNIIK